MNMLARHRKCDLAGTNQMSQPFEEMMKSFLKSFPGFRSELLFGSAIDSKLEVDIRENEVSLQLPCPGCKTDDFEIEAVGDFVTIKVKKRDKKSEHDHNNQAKECCCHYLCQERSFSEYEESIKLPVNIDGSQAAARYVDGILTVTIPRLAAEQGKVRQIKITE